MPQPEKSETHTLKNNRSEKILSLKECFSNGNKSYLISQSQDMLGIFAVFGKSNINFQYQNNHSVVDMKELIKGTKILVGNQKNVIQGQRLNVENRQTQ